MADGSLNSGERLVGATGQRAGIIRDRDAYSFGPFVLDAQSFELRRKGVRLRARPSSIDLLLLLVSRRGSLVSRDEIASRLWKDSSMVDVDQGINSAIRKIRELLRDDPASPKFLETVVAKGYKFIAEVRAIDASEFLSAKPVEPVAKAVPVLSDGGNIHDECLPASRMADGAGAESLVGEEAQVGAPRRDNKRLLGIYLAAGIMLLAGVGFLLAHLRKTNPTVVAPSLTLSQVTANDSELRLTASAISPDGKWIAYADSDGMFLRLIDKGTNILLKPPHELVAERISWYPDQTRLLVSGFERESSSPQLWLVFVTGSAPRLLRDKADAGVVSPDGNSIAFRTNRKKELWVSGAEGEGARVLITKQKAMSGAFWSGDGHRIVFMCNPDGLGSGDFQTIDASTGNVLLTKAGLSFDSGYALRDGRMFLLRDVSKWHRDHYALVEAQSDAATGEIRGEFERVASLSDGRASVLTMAEDGSRSSFLRENGIAHVFAGRLKQPGPELTGVERITFDTRTDYPGAWLHDSKTVIFESERTEFFQLYSQAVGERTAREIETGQGPVVLPQVTPDGKWILYLKSPGVQTSERSKVFRIPAEGGSPEQIPMDEPIDEFRCPMRTGTGCVLRETIGKQWFRYYVFDPVQGKGKLIGQTAWLPNVNSDWAVSPDATEVALTVHDPGDPKVRLVPIDGKAGHVEREISLNRVGKLEGIDWSADAKGWFVSLDVQAGTLLLFLGRDGNSHMFRELPSGSWGVASPDGTRLAFVDRVEDSNVWMWERDKKKN